MTAKIIPFPTVLAAELGTEESEQPWLVETLFSRGVGVIGGMPKSCKTWLGLDIAVSVATATPCLGHYAVHDAGPVLIYLAEDSAVAVRERLKALATLRGLDVDDVDLRAITVPSLRLDWRDDLQRLAATVATLRPRLLLLDPLVRLHRTDE